MLQILFKVYDKNNNLKSYIVKNNNFLVELPGNTNKLLSGRFTAKPLREDSKEYKEIIESINNSNNELLHENNIYELENIYNKRFCFDDAYNYLKNPKNKRAVALIGARRTGKTILIEQIIEQFLRDGIFKSEEIKYYTLDLKEITTITVEDILEVVRPLVGTIRLLAIDEISSLEDFSIRGGTLINYCNANGIKLLISGTYSAIITESRHDNCLGRIKFIDTTFISLREYKYLKNSDVSIDDFIKQGFILDTIDDTVDNYLNTTIAVNIAKALDTVTYSYKDFDEEEIRELTEVVLKYFKYIGMSKTLRDFYKKLSSEDLSQPLSILNKKDDSFLVLSKSDKSEIVLNSVQEQFKDFGIKLLDSTLLRQDEDFIVNIDRILTDLNLIYGVIEITGYTIVYDNIKKYRIAYNSLSLFQGYKYDFIKALTNDILNESFFSIEQQKILNNKIETNCLGLLLEEIINLELIHHLQKTEELEKSEVSLDKLQLRVLRKYSPYLRKFRINYPERNCTKEIDLIWEDDKTLRLYEIKHSSQAVDEQFKWLQDEDVETDLREYYGESYSLERYVLYLGENKVVDTTTKIWKVENKQLVDTELGICQPIKIKYINVCDFLESLH